MIKRKKNDYIILIAACYIILVLFNKNVFCMTYYIDNIKGNDLNPGAYSQPWQTIKKGVRVILPGDVLIIRSNGIDKPYRESITLKKSGTVDNWITIQGESESDKPVVEGYKKNAMLIDIVGQSFIEIKNLKLQKNKGQGVHLWRQSHDIKITNLDISHISRNGILVIQGGYNIFITDCVLDTIGNSGIAFIGHPKHKLHDTFISNCTIKNIKSNDGITFHKDKHSNNIGKNHLIQNNIISNCAENGLDITSGQNIKLINNKTSSNHDSGIYVGMGVRGYTIQNHYSHNEKKYGFIISDSFNGTIENSIIKNPGSKACLFVSNCNNLNVKNNQFYSKGKHPLIDFEKASEHLSFNDNKLLFESGSKAMMIRVLHFSMEDHLIQWNRNTWVNPSGHKRVFYDSGKGIMYFKAFKSKYANNDRFYKTLDK